MKEWKEIRSRSPGLAFLVLSHLSGSGADDICWRRKKLCLAKEMWSLEGHDWMQLWCRRREEDGQELVWHGCWACDWVSIISDSARTQHWVGQRQAQTVPWGPSIGGPLLLGGLSCQDALSPSSCWSVLPWMAVFPAAVLSSGGGDFVWVILFGKETSGFFPPWCEQLRGKISIAILFSRSQLGAGRLENADLNL